MRNILVAILAVFTFSCTTAPYADEYEKQHFEAELIVEIFEDECNPQRAEFVSPEECVTIEVDHWFLAKDENGKYVVLPQIIFHHIPVKALTTEHSGYKGGI